MGSKKRLIAAATKLFYRKGFSAVGTQEICQEAEVNKGTFYHFFPSKMALAREALTNYAEVMAEKQGKILTSKIPAREKLDLLCESFLAINQELADDTKNIYGCLIGNIACEIGQDDESMAEHIHQLIEQNCQGMAFLVEELIEQFGIEDPVELEEGAKRIMAYVDGCLIFARAQNNLDELRLRIGGCVALLYKNLDFER